MIYIGTASKLNHARTARSNIHLNCHNFKDTRERQNILKTTENLNERQKDIQMKEREKWKVLKKMQQNFLIQFCFENLN